MMRRPDQRLKSSLGKTFVTRMDGISVGTTFPPGLLVVGTGGSCYQQKWQHDKRSDADAHTRTFCPTSTCTTPKALIRHLHFTSVSKLCFIQYLCTTANPLNPTPTPTNTSIHRRLTLLHNPSPKKTLRLHHRGLTGNPDTTHC